jgi:hypothetical protein
MQKATKMSELIIVQRKAEGVNKWIVLRSNLKVVKLKKFVTDFFTEVFWEKIEIF